MAPPPSSGQNDMLTICLVGFAQLPAHFCHIALGLSFPLLRDEFSVSYTALGLVITLFYGVSGMSPELCIELATLPNVVAIKYSLPREIHKSLTKSAGDTLIVSTTSEEEWLDNITELNWQL